MAELPPQPDADEANPAGLRGLRALLWGLAALAALIAVAAAFGGHKRAPAGQDFADGVGGPFRLVAPDGSVVSDRTLKGTPFAIFFGFTRCPDVCPTTLARMARLRQQLGADGGKFRIVFVSVDPERDSPAAIGRYVALFGTPILGLTGDAQQLERIVKAYRVYYRKVPLPGGDYTVDHTAGVYLMDRTGRLQSIVDQHDSESAALGKLRRLIA